MKTIAKYLKEDRNTSGNEFFALEEKPSLILRRTDALFKKCCGEPMKRVVVVHFELNEEGHEMNKTTLESSLSFFVLIATTLKRS